MFKSRLWTVPLRVAGPSARGARLGLWAAGTRAPVQPMTRAPWRAAVAAYATKPPRPPSERPPVRLPIDTAHEREVGARLLERHPEAVTATSSLAHPHLAAEAAAEAGARVPGDEPAPVLEALGKDVHSIQAALNLEAVPRASYALGLGGTLPYFATSLATVYLGWNLHHAYPTASPLANSFLLSHETAQHWLQVLEPIQLGYGAVLLSFLGAIHWGLEYAEKSPAAGRTAFRYGVGIAAVAVAWPTLYLPVPFALTAQFLAFTALYFADSRATARGWAPAWYATYRFVLTFVVGAAILISLVYRAKAGDAKGPGSDGATGASRRMSKRLTEGKHQGGQPVEEAYGQKWERLEKEEKRKLKEEEKEKKEKKEKGGKGEEGKTKEKEEGEKGQKEEKEEDSEGKEEKEDKEKDEKDGDKEKKEKKDDSGQEDGSKDSKYMDDVRQNAATATDGGKKH